MFSVKKGGTVCFATTLNQPGHSDRAMVTQRPWHDQSMDKRLESIPTERNRIQSRVSRVIVIITLRRRAWPSSRLAPREALGRISGERCLSYDKKVGEGANPVFTSVSKELNKGDGNSLLRECVR
jgi:hypothetical protein